MSKRVYEVIEEAQKKRTKAGKIDVFRNNDSWALRDVLRGTFDTSIEWNLPPGEPPYEPAESHNHPTELTRENTKFKYFIRGFRVSESMSTIKRESLFIGLLEGVHPDDAKLVIDMTNKTAPKYITRQIVEEAFPDLLKD
jgi:hypothetical protein